MHIFFNRLFYLFIADKGLSAYLPPLLPGQFRSLLKTEGRPPQLNQLKCFTKFFDI